MGNSNHSAGVKSRQMARPKEAPLTKGTRSLGSGLPIEYIRTRTLLPVWRDEPPKGKLPQDTDRYN